MIDRLQTWTDTLLKWAAPSFWRQAILVTLLSALVLVPGLASMPVTDRDEARFAQATKQMLETGDLIDIRFQDQPRWKKPVGIYWLQAASASVFGGTEAPIWAYRIPSAIGAWLAALFTLWGARVLIGQREALLAGAMVATSLLLVAEGHIAKTDAALAATAAAALGALAHIFLGRGRWGAALVFWLAIATSILLKGPIVPVIAAITLAVLWWQKETRPHFNRLHLLPGFALVVLLVAPWLIAIWDVSDGRFFAESIGKDMAGKIATGQEKHWGPPGLYLGLVWLTFWPWAALIPLAAVRIWRDDRTVKGWALLAWLIPFWLILEAVPTKLPHYVLPLYPALAMLVAVHVSAPAAVPIWARRSAAILVALPGIAISIAVIALPWLPELVGDVPKALLAIKVAPMAVLLSAGAMVAILLAAQAAFRGKVLAQVTASIAAALLLYPAILARALPAAHAAFPSPTMAKLIGKYRACATGPAFTIGYNEPSLVFLTETALRTAQPGPALKALRDDPGTLLLIEDRWIDIVGPLPPHVVRDSVTYFNPNRGRFATTRVVTQDHPRWTACQR